MEIEGRNIAIVARKTPLSSITRPFVGAATSLRLHRPCALAGAVGKDPVEEVLAATFIEGRPSISLNVLAPSSFRSARWKSVVQPRVLQPTRQHEKMRDEPNLYAAIQVCADDLPVLLMH